MDGYSEHVVMGDVFQDVRRQVGLDDVLSAATRQLVLGIIPE
jgi:hypothetical protein